MARIVSYPDPQVTNLQQHTHRLLVMLELLEERLDNASGLELETEQVLADDAIKRTRALRDELERFHRSFGGSEDGHLQVVR